MKFESFKLPFTSIESQEFCFDFRKIKKLYVAHKKSLSMSQKCCAFDRCILNGKCDTQHMCPDCKRYIHAICGCAYYEKNGQPVEDLTYPRKCFQCFAKNKYKKDDKDDKSKKSAEVAKPKAKKGSAKKKKATTRKESTPSKSSSKTSKQSPTPTKKKTKKKSSTTDNADQTPKSNKKDKEKSSEKTLKEASNSDAVVVVPTDIWSDEEKKKYHPGFFVPGDLKKGEIVLNQFAVPPSNVNANTKIIGIMVHIPTMFWGELILRSRWWKKESWNKELNEKNDEDIRRRVILNGKVIQKSTKPNYYDVAFVANVKNDDIATIPKSDIRRFIVIDENSSAASKTKTKRSKKNRNNADSDSDSSFDEEEDLIEVDEFVSEDENQVTDEENEDDNSGDEENDAEKQLWTRKDPRKKVDCVWKLIEDHRSTSYTRPITSSYVNNVRHGDWANLTPYEIFNLQLPEEEFELWTRFLIFHELSGIGWFISTSECIF